MKRRCQGFRRSGEVGQSAVNRGEGIEGWQRAMCSLRNEKKVQMIEEKKWKGRKRRCQGNEGVGVKIMYGKRVRESACSQSYEKKV